MRRCKTGKFAEMMESELWDHFLSCFHRNYMFGRKGGFGFEKKLPSKDQLAWLEMKQVRFSIVFLVDFETYILVGTRF